MDPQCDLFHDLANEIAATETADLHSHLVWHRPQAQSLGHFVFYHFVQNELCAAGMPLAHIRLEDEDERLRAALPWLDRIANTGTSYGMRRALADLYGVPDGRLTEANLAGVAARFRETAADADWPREVVRRRARLRRVLVSHQLGHPGQPGFAELSAGDPAATRYNGLFLSAGEQSLQFDDNFALFFDPDFAARHPERLRRFRDGLPATAVEWADSAWHYLTPDDLARLKAVLTWTSVKLRHFPGGLDAVRGPAEAAWKAGLAGQRPDDAGTSALRMLGFYTMVEKARALGVPMQVFFGSIAQDGERGAWKATHVDYDPATIREFGLIAGENRDVRFDFLEGAVNNSQEMAIMAKMRPNVGATGLWWHAMYPSYIRRVLAERLDAAPLTKTCLFFSDAYMTEWCYAKRKLVEREFAFVLAERVAYGYLTREDASRVIGMWMRENPARTYGIPELLD